MKFSYLKTKNPYYNLAVEEYLLKHTNEEYILLWQNDPTVVIGKNQNAFAEVNLEHTKEKGIYVARRITGGGAVYHDHGNLNYSYIAKKEGSEIDFERFSRPVIDALCDMRISATLSGRNDILIGERKISGNAQTVYEDRVLHHGTLLFNSDLDVLSDALRVDEEKIKAKAIKSTRSRVANISEFLSDKFTLDDFANRIKNFIITRYNAAEVDIKENDKIKLLTERNASKDWIFSERDYLSRFSICSKKRYNFGSVAISLDMKNDMIVAAKIEGDFFGVKDISELENKLLGTSIENITLTISKLKISDFIFGMTEKEFLEQIKK